MAARLSCLLALEMWAGMRAESAQRSGRKVFPASAGERLGKSLRAAGRSAASAQRSRGLARAGPPATIGGPERQLDRGPACTGRALQQRRRRFRMGWPPPAANPGLCGPGGDTVLGAPRVPATRPAAGATCIRSPSRWTVDQIRSARCAVTAVSDAGERRYARSRARPPAPGDRATICA